MPRDTLETTSTPLARTRRRFLVDAGVGALGLASALSALPPVAVAGHHEEAELPLALLEESPFVYISPLRSDGRESRCHAELWYAWLDESVVVTVASDRWKARALARGLDRARVWVGDHGRSKTRLGTSNEAFREAPHFDCRAEKVTDPKTIERLLAIYERKYPGEIDSWRDRMRKGNADGSRIMIRYRPTPRRPTSKGSSGS